MPTAYTAKGRRATRAKEFKGEGLDVQPSIMQMNPTHESFLVLSSLDTGHINVDYQLDDGNYGLIETGGHVDSEE